MIERIFVEGIPELPSSFDDQNSTHSYLHVRFSSPFTKRNDKIHEISVRINKNAICSIWARGEVCAYRYVKRNEKCAALTSRKKYSSRNRWL